jgi:hypothetical protein
VPALPDLDLPQPLGPLGPLGARRALVLPGRPAGQVDQFGLPGGQVGAAQRDGADADVRSPEGGSTAYGRAGSRA